jgi:hypothetical protein
MQGRAVRRRIPRVVAEESRSWLPDALGRKRREALEDTLFRQLEQLEQGPLERLGELVGRVLGDLREAQRRLAEQATALRTLQTAVAELTARVERVEALPAPAPAPVVNAHLLLLSSAEGYRLVERDGSPPAPGEVVDVDGAAWQVLRPGGSPLPDDPRRCLLAFNAHTA